jgi:hypothetical protein
MPNLIQFIAIFLGKMMNNPIMQKPTKQPECDANAVLPKVKPSKDAR